MYGLGALPRISERLVSRRAYITSDQRVHRLGSHISRRLPRASDLGYLSVKDSLLVGIDFEGRQDIYLLD